MSNTLIVDDPFQCQECMRILTIEEAELANEGDGCPECGSFDIDIAV